MSFEAGITVVRRVPSAIPMPSIAPPSVTGQVDTAPAVLTSIYDIPLITRSKTDQRKHLMVSFARYQHLDQFELELAIGGRDVASTAKATLSDHGKTVQKWRREVYGPSSYIYGLVEHKLLLHDYRVAQTNLARSVAFNATAQPNDTPQETEVRATKCDQDRDELYIHSDWYSRSLDCEVRNAKNDLEDCRRLKEVWKTNKYDKRINHLPRLIQFLESHRDEMMLWQEPNFQDAVPIEAAITLADKTPDERQEYWLEVTNALYEPIPIPMLLPCKDTVSIYDTINNKTFKLHAEFIFLNMAQHIIDKHLEPAIEQAYQKSLGTYFSYDSSRSKKMDYGLLRTLAAVTMDGKKAAKKDIVTVWKASKAGKRPAPDNTTGMPKKPRNLL